MSAAAELRRTLAALGARHPETRWHWLTIGVAAAFLAAGVVVTAAFTVTPAGLAIIMAVAFAELALIGYSTSEISRAVIGGCCEEHFPAAEVTP